MNANKYGINRAEISKTTNILQRRPFSNVVDEKALAVLKRYRLNIALDFNEGKEPQRIDCTNTARDFKERNYEEMQ